MTRKCVTDDQYGQLKRRMDELARRVDEGTISFDRAMKALQYFIEDKFRFGGEQKEFPFKVWRTLKLGTGLKTADDFRKALKQSGNKVSSYANDLLEKIKAATEETEVDLCKLSVAELTGKKEVATTNEVFAGADRLGFERCTPEVGPQLRIQYPDQPMGETLFIGMDLITGRDGSPCVFRLERGVDGLWLYGRWAVPESEWSPGGKLVFRLRKFSKES